MSEANAYFDLMKRNSKILQLQIRVSLKEKAAIFRHAHKAEMGVSE